jgi:HEAT repeat protein
MRFRAISSSGPLGTRFRSPVDSPVIDFIYAMNVLKVFISGTQLDMQPERDAASSAVDRIALAVGIRAETALSQPHSPLAWITDQLQTCDIYVGIYSHRYGWILPQLNLSATEFEFNLAHQLGKPILIWIRELKDFERDLPNFDRQQHFLERVSDFSNGYLRQEFREVADLDRWVSQALRETIINLVKGRTSQANKSGWILSPAVVTAYLEQIAAQKPYVLWSDLIYIDRTVTEPDSMIARRLVLYDPNSLEEEPHTPEGLLDEVLAREKRIILLGNPGLGKTTSLVHLAWQTARRTLRLGNSPARPDVNIPIYFELKYYGGEPELEVLLARRINEILRPRNLTLGFDLSDSTRVLKAWLGQSETRFLFLLDGLNEVRSEFHTAIRGLLRDILHSQHLVVVACREHDYDHSLQEYAFAYVLEGLRPNEIENYLVRILGDPGQQLLRDLLMRDRRMETLGANPLMLWLISLIVRDAPQLRLPANQGQLFQRVIEAMPHLRTSEGIEPKKPLDTIVLALSKLAFDMQSSGIVTVDLSELRRLNIPTSGESLVDVLTQAKEWRFLKSDGRMGEQIEFLHQLFLEYFAASYLNAELRSGKNFDEVLSGRIFSEPWDEVIVMLAGIIDQPVALIKWLGAQILINNQWAMAFLVKRCWETTAINNLDARLAVLQVLFAALVKGRATVRRQAASALGVIRDPSAIDQLLVTLRYDRTGVAKSAADALAEIGKPAVVPLVNALTEQNRSVRRYAAYALGKIGDSKAIWPLLACLQDPNDAVRREAAAALRAFCDPTVISHLIAALRDEDIDVRRSTADSLAKLGTDAVLPLIDALRDKNAGVRMNAAYVLGAIGDARAVAPLIGSLQDLHVDIRRQAAHALGVISDPNAISHLLRTLDDESVAVRGSAANALVNIGVPAIAPLIDALQGETVDDHWCIMYALEKIGADAVEPLIQSLSSGDKYTRDRIMDVLSRIGHTAFKPLINALRSTNLVISTIAANILVRIGSAAVEPLISLLQDEDIEVRGYGANILGEIGDSRAVDPLIAALHDENPFVRESVIKALEHLDDPRAGSALEFGANEKGTL